MEKPHEMKTNQISTQQGIAIGVLSMVLVSVGVWQWHSMSGRKPSPRTANAAAAATAQNPSTASRAAGNALTGASFTPFPARDPFRPTITAAFSTPNRLVPPEKTSQKTTPRTITGTPPVPPIALPPPGGLEIKQTDAPEPTPVPDWTLVGIVQGPRPLAILKDSEGNRRFVQLGDRLEGGWRVRRIERGRLTLQKGQQTISVNVGSSTTSHENPASRSTGGIQQ